MRQNALKGKSLSLSSVNRRIDAMKNMSGSDWRWKEEEECKRNVKPINKLKKEKKSGGKMEGED